MKKLFTLLIGFVFFFVILRAQDAPPQAFSLKATIQGTNGQTVVDKVISLRITILQDDINGVPIYSESFAPTPDHYSQVAVEIGKGKVLSGIFSTIDWSTHKYFLKIEVDAKGGTSYQLLSVTQLLSVPYALYAGKASSALNEFDPIFLTHPAYGITNGDIINWNTTEWSEIQDKPTFSKVATSGSYNDLSNKPTGNKKGDMLYWNGTDWVIVPVGTNGTALILSNGSPVWNSLSITK